MMNLHNPSQKYQSIALPDGRQLGYAEYGVPNGSPVLFFHGMPGSSYVHTDMADIATQRGTRLIAVDRPGYGLSEPHSDRTLLSWPDDIAALTDVLGLPQFAIIGFSGGSPYALACASKLPLRITKMALVGAFAPLNAPGITECLSPSLGGLYALAQANPVELRSTLAAIATSPAALLTAMCASLPDWDKNEVHKRISEFETEYARTLRGGIEGVASDFVLASQGWNITLNEINTETHLWCGTDDGNTPPAMTHYLASQLPNNHTFILPDEGHLALYVHWEEILKRLI